MHRWIDVRGRPDLLPEESDDPKKRITIVGCLNYREDDPDFDINCNAAIFEYERRLATTMTHYFVLKPPRKMKLLDL